MKILQFLIFAILTTSTLPCFADIRFGLKVQYVSDGDTLKAILSNGESEWVRLAQIDAPEKNQPFGLESKALLKNLLDCPSPLQLKSIGRDKYKRIIGEIFCADESINRKMVLIGGAWVYREYATHPAIVVEEKQAKAEKLGLWAAPNPIPPWIWRKK